MVVLDKPIKTLGLHEVKVRLHPEVTVTVTLNIARSQDEAERQARGENVINAQFEEDRIADEQAAGRPARRRRGLAGHRLRRGLTPRLRPHLTTCEGAGASSRAFCMCSCCKFVISRGAAHLSLSAIRVVGRVGFTAGLFQGNLHEYRAHPVRRGLGRDSARHRRHGAVQDRHDRRGRAAPPTSRSWSSPAAAPSRARGSRPLAPVDVVTAADAAEARHHRTRRRAGRHRALHRLPAPVQHRRHRLVRPATLRGQAPDQTLVLINGVRAHTSALVNLNGSVGRGSAAVDLNTIPTIAIDRIEVLRDGASALYGSDAIAGVINLRPARGRPRRRRDASPTASTTPTSTSSTPASSTANDGAHHHRRRPGRACRWAPTAS